MRAQFLWRMRVGVDCKKRESAPLKKNVALIIFRRNTETAQYVERI